MAKTLADLEAPYPVYVNLSSHKPYKTERDRREVSRFMVSVVAELLKNLNKKYNLGLEIRFNGEFEVVALKGKEEIARFYYYETARRICRKQNFEKLLKLIESVVENE